MASKDRSVFNSGPAIWLGPTPEVGPTTESEPASTGGPQAEFYIADRTSLLNTLKDALKGDVPSTVWACLWLSDIDKLKELVDRVKRDTTPWLGYFTSIESEAKIVQTWGQRARSNSTTSTPQRLSTPQALPFTTQLPTSQQQYSPPQYSPPQYSPQQYSSRQSSPLRLQSIPQSGSPRAQKRLRGDDEQQYSPRQSSPLRLPSSPQSGNSRAQKRPRRNDDAKALCLQRDRLRCVLTAQTHPLEVAHIYPLSMRNLREPVTLPPNSFWAVLRLFWSQDRIDSWYNAIFSSDAGTEVVTNLMCLCSNAHKLHEKTFFALKPIEISNDEKTLKVEFYWLPKYSHSDQVDILRTPSIPEHFDEKPLGVGLWNLDTGEKIRSGDIIYIKTDNPDDLPLPDFRLLEMQWILHRVSALSGAAELSDDFNDDNDDNWDVALENDDLDDLLAEDEWSAYTPSPRKSSPPSSPIPPPSPTKEVVFGTSADESIISSAGEAIDSEAKAKKDTPKDEGKGKRIVGLGAVAEFEEIS